MHRSNSVNIVFIIILNIIIWYFVMQNNSVSESRVNREKDKLHEVYKNKPRPEAIAIPVTSVTSKDCEDKYGVKLVDNQVVCKGECHFKSQLNEDREMITYLLSKHQPDELIGHGHIIFELGGHTGIEFSNSYFFEYNLGWKAFLIEPNRNSFPILMNNRPHATNLWMAACQKEQTLKFVDVGAMGALEDSIPTGHDARFNGQTKYDVDCLPLSKVFRMFGVKKIDIFFLDVEGSELEAIQGIDFKQIEILHFVIECAVEHEVKNKQFLAILKENGYVWVSGDFNQHWELKKD